MNISQSKVRAWRNCRRAYHHKHHDQIQPKKTRRPFVFGKIVHRMIEAQAQEEDPFEVLEKIEIDSLPIFSAEKEMYGDIITDIGVIMTDYFDYHKDGLRFLPVRDETGELRYAEHEFAVPLEELVKKSMKSAVRGIVFKGQVDGLGKTPNKLRWLVETKTFDRMPGDDERWRNLQSVVYARAVIHLGWMKSMDGVCWNYVMSKAPTVPQLLKDKSRLSVKEVTTLPSVVRATLKVHNLSEDTHEELLRRAERSRHDYFKRVYSPVSATVAENIFDGFVETAIEMRDNDGKKKDQNIGRHCGWCDYESLCRADITGGDVDFVRRTEYVKEDPEAYRRTKRSDKLKVIKE